jgi:hypothetical protein
MQRCRHPGRNWFFLDDFRWVGFSTKPPNHPPSSRKNRDQKDYTTARTTTNWQEQTSSRDIASRPAEPLDSESNRGIQSRTGASEGAWAQNSSKVKQKTSAHAEGSRLNKKVSGCIAFKNLHQDPGDREISSFKL